jgi:biopolymer transport protein ExbD
MAFSTGGDNTDFSEINITPLTDVFLILFLIMIVIAPLINQTALKIDPPKAQHGKTMPSKTKAINLEIDAEGMIAINNKRLSDKPIQADKVYELVSKRLEEIMQDPEYKEAALNIVADSETKQKYMVGAMDAATGLGLTKMNIVTVSGM